MAGWVETRFKERVRPYDETMMISIERRDALVSYCRPFAKYIDDAYFNGLNIRLYTNIEHVHDFWCDNWYQWSPFVIPHGEVYVIDDGGRISLEDLYEHPVSKPEINAGGVYNPETRTAIILNTDYYGQTKSTALGLAADILEDQFGILSVHGASGAVDEKGFLLIGPTNAGKTTHSYGPAFYHPDGEFHQDDWIFVRFVGGKAVGDASEKKFYMRTNSIKNFPWLESLYRQNKLENVRPDDPREKYLPGYPRVMVDPRVMMAPERVVDQIRVNKTFLLKRDPSDNMVIKSLDPDEAVEVLRKASERWYNNYLISFGKRKEERRAELFRKLFEKAEPCQVNITADVEKVRQMIIEVTKS